MPVAIVVGTLAPYRHRLYEAYAEAHCGDLHVLSCAPIEPHRTWSVPPPRHYALHFLKGFRYHASMTSHFYVNPSVVTTLARLRPELIFTADFAPTMALAAFYATIAGVPYGVGTDGHRRLSAHGGAHPGGIDPGERSALHRLMRRVLVPRAAFGIGASEDSVRLLEHWGLAAGLCTVVPVGTVWDPPDRTPSREQRPYHILFAGTVDERKGTLFFADVVGAVKARGLDPKVRVVGDGPLRGELEARLTKLGIKARFDGALQPQDMVEVFSSAQMLLFPSRGDAWGLVANEAVMCSTPVIGSPHAASSVRLLERFGVGIVRPLEVDLWATATVEILTSPERWNTLVARQNEATRWFSLDRQVAEFHRAIEIGRYSGRSPAKAGLSAP
jgi:glycosyltransferase involved in cell wall biosynthesis